jgi:hypothetical protein
LQKKDNHVRERDTGKVNRIPQHDVEALVVLFCARLHGFAANGHVEEQIFDSDGRAPNAGACLRLD